MPPGNRTSSSTSVASGRRTKEEPQSWSAAVPSRAQLAAAFAQALDLAEGRPPGHAARVCYIALRLAQTVSVGPEERRNVYYASLLHDAGAGPASAELCRLLNVSEEKLFGGQPGRSPHQLALEIAPSNGPSVVEVLHAHPERGVHVARELGFDLAVQEAIATHHERWDGHGYPRALKEEASPVAGRLVSAADLIEALISAEVNPLTARRNLVSALSEFAGTALQPELADQARGLVRSDAFWLGIHNDALVRELAASCPSASETEQPSLADLLAFAEVFAGLADGRGEHTANHSQRTADLADDLAQSLGFSNGRREMLRVAAMLHDVGLLGVPARIIAKPDILSLSEMEAMRRHPTFSQMLLAALPGLEEIAGWVGAHHERPDGKGYPEMLEDEGIPLEGRIIAVADTYVALTSPRPYRKALSQDDARKVLLGGAGAQLDRKLVDLLCAGLTSSRTARRSAQRR